MHSGFTDEEGSARVESMLDRAERLRDLRIVELGLFVLAVLGGQAALWGMTGVAGLLKSGADAPSITIARIWYSVVALPIFQFMLVRWLWRWVIWSRLLVQTSRIPFKLMITHPDHAGGIGMFSDPSLAFAIFAAGSSSVIAAEWAMRLSLYNEDPESFVLPCAVLAVLSLLLAFGPMPAFLPGMLRARYQGSNDYSSLSLVYARVFYQRHIEKKSNAPLLGMADISSLAHVQSTFESMMKMRIVPFGPRSTILVVAGVLAPMAPLLVFEIPIQELILKIGNALFFGLSESSE